MRTGNNSERGTMGERTIRSLVRVRTSEPRANKSLVNYCGMQVTMSLEMSQDVGRMDALMSTKL